MISSTEYGIVLHWLWRMDWSRYSCSPKSMLLLMMTNLSRRSTGMPWGDTMSVPRMVQIPDVMKMVEEYAAHTG